MSKKFSSYQSWRQTLYGHLALARVSNSPTVVSNTLAGATLAGARQVDGKIALVAIAMILFYSAGMYLNDLLDYVIDCRERPKRPLPAGIVSQRAALVGVIALFGCGSVLLLTVGLYPFLSGLVLIGLIIFYDRWHKSNPFSPLLMALCRGLVYVTAFLAFCAQSFFNLLLPCCLLILYVIGLTSLAKIGGTSNIVGIGLAPVREMLAHAGQTGCNIPSLWADRGKPSPYESSTSWDVDVECPTPRCRCVDDGLAASRPLRSPVPPAKSTVLSARPLLANVGIMVTLFLPAVYFMLQPSLLSHLFALVFAAWVLYSIIFIYDSPEPQVGRTVGQLIAGISLLDSLVLLASGNYHGLLLALVAFGLTLFLQRYVKGT